jgi:hypothetical protein
MKVVKKTFNISKIVYIHPKYSAAIGSLFIFGPFWPKMAQKGSDCGGAEKGHHLLGGSQTVHGLPPSSLAVLQAPPA